MSSISQTAPVQHSRLDESEPILEAGRTLGVVGAGVMGQTLLRGLFDSGLVDRKQVWAAAKSQDSCERVAGDLGIPVERDYSERVPNAGVLLLCVKPDKWVRCWRIYEMPGCAKIPC
jgi:pyrroline-5-carboxylate reductase